LKTQSMPEIEGAILALIFPVCDISSNRKMGSYPPSAAGMTMAGCGNSLR